MDVEFSIQSANNLLEELHRHQERIFFSEKEAAKITRESVEPLLKKTCADIARLMNCERVEIWLFNEDRSLLTLETSFFSRGLSQNMKGVLYQHKVPNYFDAIVNQRTLAVSDTRISPIMEGLRDSLPEDYHSVESMLDASIVLSSGVGGVICCLSDTKQQWTPIHRHVLASVADMFAFIFDRLHRQEAEEHIYNLAYTDMLTKLKNEHAFYDLVTADLKTYPEGQQGVFIYMVIDQYPSIQGVLGYQGAEKILVTVAQRLQRLLPEPAVIARRAFDHFVIYAPIIIEQAEMKTWMEKITKEINRSMHINDQEVYITVSYGASFYPNDVDNAREGLQAAQVALENGRKNKTHKASGIFHSSMRTFIKENLFSEMNLRKGLDSEQFRLFYQPKVQCQTGEVLGFEALIRWKHPEKGLVFPGAFIELAESTGLISTIDNWVIREAFKQLGKWSIGDKNHLNISINISSDYFIHSKLPDYLRQCAKGFNVSPERLILEVTERIALEDRIAVKSRMTELQEMGYVISIDDFGTGYSAFVYLQDYSVQEIKVDRQFIKSIEKDVKSEMITSSIVQLGKRLGLRTVAEGVETVGEWEKLKEMECDEIQGFYFSKPLPIEEIEKMMEKVKVNDTFYLP